MELKLTGYAAPKYGLLKIINRGDINVIYSNEMIYDEVKVVYLSKYPSYFLKSFKTLYWSTI